MPLVVDVSGAAGGAAFVAAATEALGGVDILVTNAGGPPPGNFASTDVDAYPAAHRPQPDVGGGDVQGGGAGDAGDAGWGRVVAITSIAVRQPIAHLILSNTARAGATGFLKTLAREVEDAGVTVNSVQPGLHRTGRVTQLYGADADVDAHGRTRRLRRHRRVPVQRRRRSSSPAPRSTSTAAATRRCNVRLRRRASRRP